VLTGEAVVEIECHPIDRDRGAAAAIAPMPIWLARRPPREARSP
jgi:hypothetical protein